MTERDDLCPLEGPEDWVTPIQHPQSSRLQRHGVSLVLSHNTAYEHEIPTHTTQELRDLSTTTDRLEFHSLLKFNFVSSVEEEMFETFLQQVAGQPSKL